MKNLLPIITLLLVCRAISSQELPRASKIFVRIFNFSFKESKLYVINGDLTKWQDFKEYTYAPQ